MLLVGGAIDIHRWSVVHSGGGAVAASIITVMLVVGGTVDVCPWGVVVMVGLVLTVVVMLVLVGPSLSCWGWVRPSSSSSCGGRRDVGYVDGHVVRIVTAGI